MSQCQLNLKHTVLNKSDLMNSFFSALVLDDAVYGKTAAMQYTVGLELKGNQLSETWH
jgi:hypothetical protein